MRAARSSSLGSPRGRFFARERTRRAPDRSPKRSAHPGCFATRQAVTRLRPEARKSSVEANSPWSLTAAFMSPSCAEVGVLGRSDPMPAGRPWATVVRLPGLGGRCKAII